jgi:PAS domain S-box-containing protein
MIGMLAISLPFLASNHLLETIVVVLLAAAYNSCLYVWSLIRHRWFASKAIILAVDIVLLALLIGLSNDGFSSPYITLLLFPIMFSALWFGSSTSLVVGITESVVAGLWLLLVSLTADWSKIATNFGFRMLLFLLVGLYLARLTREQRHEKHNIMDKDLQIDQERQQLLALINIIGDAVLVVDQQGNINMFNEMTAHLTGSQYALVGKPLSEVFPMHDEKGQLIDPLSITSASTLRRRDLKLALNDGSIINVEVDISPYIVNSTNRGFIVILRDISKEKTLEEEQEDFISVASHELRTPLAIVEANISNSLAAPDTQVAPAIRNMLTGAHNNVGFLSNIIDDLTTLSKAKQDALEVDVDPLNPGALLDELHADFAPQAQAKGLTVSVNVSPEVTPILTSSFRIKQVLHNFITNAIKYTQSGSITLSVANAPHGNGTIVFSISDTGIGISLSDQKKVFTKFFRSEAHETQQSNGTGLGLYIASQLAQRLNGKVWFESELNKGSTFYLEVPPYSQLKKDGLKPA